MRTYIIAIAAVLAIIFILSGVGFIKEVEVAMPKKNGLMIQYNSSVQAVADRTAR